MAAITSAVVGVVGAGVSIGMSVDQANKAAAQRRKAQQAAKKAMDEAMRETEIMPNQELALNLDVYEQQREAQNVAAATGIQAAQQAGSRELAAAVGRQQMANIEGQRKVRTDQAKDMFELEKIKAAERAKASDTRAGLALGEAEGAQAAAADAAARQQQATTQAVQAGVEGFGSAMNLYSSVQGPYDSTALGATSKSMVNKMGIEPAKNAIALNLPEGSSYTYDQIMAMDEPAFLSAVQSGSLGTSQDINALVTNFDASMYGIQ